MKPILFLLSLISVTVYAQTVRSYIPNQTPDSRYILHNNGTVTDTVTTLMWKVCSEGETWTPDNCTVNLKGYTWDKALQRGTFVNTNGGFAGHTDWRLPNLKELGSIIALDRHDPAINITIFPAPYTAASSDVTQWWSSSPYARAFFYDSIYKDAWNISFYSGTDSNAKRNNKYRVRLVRGGQYY